MLEDKKKNKKIENILSCLKNIRWILLILGRIFLIFLLFIFFDFYIKNRQGIGAMLSFSCSLYNCLMILYELTGEHNPLIYDIEKNDENLLILSGSLLFILIELYIIGYNLHSHQLLKSILLIILLYKLIDHACYIFIGHRYMIFIFFTLIFVGNYINVENYGIILTILTLFISIIDEDVLKNLMQIDGKINKHKFIKYKINTIVLLSFVYISILISDYAKMNLPDTFWRMDLYLKIKIMTGSFTPIYFRFIIVAVMYFIYFMCKKIFGASVKDYIERKFFYNY